VRNAVYIPKCSTHRTHQRTVRSKGIYGRVMIILVFWDIRKTSFSIFQLLMVLLYVLIYFFSDRKVNLVPGSLKATVGHVFERRSCGVNSERPLPTFYYTIRLTGVRDENLSLSPLPVSSVLSEIVLRTYIVY